MRGKIIVIEGTDCSGKETQTNMLYNRLKEENKDISRLSFPDYNSPTGKIIGGPYLGKKHISEGYFSEGASNVDPKVASLYFGADRRFHLKQINELLDAGVNVILDRYVTSNMGHQGGKITNKKERLKMYNWLETLEYGLLELPKPDLVIFLHMPYQISLELKKNRGELLDQHESNKEHLINAEIAYLEIAELYDFITIDCYVDDKVKTKEQIHEELYKIVKNFM
jgi:dTMP kinase